MAKRFFYVCAGLFLLALHYHVGARSATAQVGSVLAGYATAGPSAQHHYVVTSTGGVWYRNTFGSGSTFPAGPP
jgi:hypothetical protein